jgi:glutaredoxin
MNGPMNGPMNPPMNPPRITLLSKPGCHLCDQAREVIERVASDLGVTWEEVDITDDPSLQSRYREQIPVTLVDGVQHDYWQVDETRLRKALAAGGGVS